MISTELIERQYQMNSNTYDGTRAWTERLEYLSNLQDGWLDGYGVPSRPEATQAANDLLLRLFPSNDEDYLLHNPGIYPHQNGGIGIEWYVSGQIISVEVMGDDYEEIYSFFEMTSDSKEWSDLDTDNLEDIVSRLKETSLFA